MNKEEVFVNRKTYPNAKDIFNMEIVPLEVAMKDCIYILDTNALLVPYQTSSSGFDEITKTFTKLIKENRLIIPGQVAREFAKNRPEKIKTLYQQLTQTKAKIFKPNTGNYPLLEKLEEYKEALEIQKKVIEIQKEYSNKINEILSKVKDWTWNDPVSEVYNRLFDQNVIYDNEINEDEVLADLEYRNKYSIPPGFKDKGKSDHGVGDLLVWHTILEVAKEKKSHIIFISGDEKTDWFYRSENQSLYPRFELLAEFKNKTGDKSFHILKLSELLELSGVDDKVVKEIERKEVSNRRSRESIMEFVRNAEDAVRLWLYTEYEDGEVLENRGFPDFKIELQNHTLGIDVMSIRASGNVHMPMHRLYEKAHRSYYEIGEGEFDEILHVVVCETEEMASSPQVISRFQSTKDRVKSEFIEFKLGFLDDNGKFIEK